MVWPGGLGTLDELFDILTLLQCKKITRKIPIVLFGKNFWNGLVDWKKMINQGTISEEDLSLFITLDSVDETYAYLVENMQR